MGYQRRIHGAELWSVEVTSVDTPDQVTWKSAAKRVKLPWLSGDIYHGMCFRRVYLRYQPQLALEISLELSLLQPSVEFVAQRIQSCLQLEHVSGIGLVRINLYLSVIALLRKLVGGVCWRKTM